MSNGKNSESFCEFLKNVKVPQGHVMVSFDVVSLFTRVPKDLAVETAINRLKADPSFCDRTALSIDDIARLLHFCLDATEFCFDEKFFKQIFGCAMGSPVSPIVSNLVMEDVEERILSNPAFHVKCWKRYVDDTFVILPDSEVSSFFDFINGVEPSINFTIEKEDAQQQLSFLDALVRRLPAGDLAFRVHRKPTHTNKYLDFSSHHPISHRRSVVRSLLNRTKTHFSDNREAEQERRLVHSVLRDNGYPPHLLRGRRRLVRSFGDRGAKTPYHLALCEERLGAHRQDTS